MQTWVIYELRAMVEEYQGSSGSTLLRTKLAKIEPSKLKSQHVIETLSALAEISRIDVARLQQEFGQRLFTHYMACESESMTPVANCFELLQQIKTLMGLEGHRLYLDSEPPRFDYLHIATDKMVMDYVSSLSFGYVIHGLILACIHYFNESIEVNMQLVDGSLNHVRFTLTRSPTPI